MSAVVRVGAAAGMPAMDPVDRCNVLVLCDNVAARDKAAGICERLSTQFGDDLPFEFSYWQLGDFTRSTLLRRAVRQCMDADIVIYATHGDDLSFEVKEWIELCAVQRNKRDGALGVLFVEPLSDSAAVGSLLSRLERAAARLRMDFLPMLAIEEEQALNDLTNQAKLMAPFSKGILDEPPSHWGLNE